ncbi:beta-galactosidase-like protein [Roseimicrobium gellanilyticum]|uniref:Beta-galactosidase-like protein n=1 Tax=Roseimicrobium gellanilyticum TaxID=748857 RepID=A0A366H6N3_9BACT|nr:beta-galactosidase [Roseimicrobium gellanilyticum]RBP37780.1 beta-galactosidase-like protein [Roseimicrobium gellanilyticum]
MNHRSYAALLGVLLSGFLTDTALAEEATLRPWPEYQVILWVSGKSVEKPERVPLFLQRAREMGVTAGMVTGEGDPAHYLKAGMPYYVENIVRTGLCLKFRSPVTDWSGFINGWMEKRDEAAFVRPYCLEDPAWLEQSKKEVVRSATKHREHQPLLYDLRDELSVTTSANPFDYDFSPKSLLGFRAWLKTEYGTLEKLNQQWDTDFATWEEVRPFTTDQIKARMVTGERMPKGPPDWSALKRVEFDPFLDRSALVRWNFSPWCDFRSYMDSVLARSLQALRLSAREVDAATPVGIEGTQMPHAFGGYDLWKLSQSLDWVEPYDVANAREIFGSFMPGKPILATVFEKETNHAMRRLWHLLLEGDKGCIIWWSEDCVDMAKPDAPLTEKGKALAPALKEMTSPLAKLFLRAEKEYDPIAIHYSQASIQVAWLIESTVDGRTWPRRFSSHEGKHNRHARVRNGWMKLLQDMGYSPRFVSTEQVEKGELEGGGYRMFVMPQSYAITDQEALAIHRWRTHQPDDHWRMVASNPTGSFDGHGRYTGPRQHLLPYLSRTTGQSAHHLKGGEELGSGSPYDMARYPANRLGEMTAEEREYMPDLANTSVGIEPPPIRIALDDCVRIHRYKLGNNARLIAFERNIDYHMSEDLAQAGGNEALEKPIQTQALLKEPAHVYDLRTGKYLGNIKSITVDLDPWKPSLYALLKEKLPEEAKVIEVLGGGK